jgi:hypothetical protein
VHAETAFLAGYALALTLVAVGLDSLGRRSTDPWSSRVLAGSQRAADRPAHQGPDWLDSEVPAFHLAISAVALAAAFTITALSAALYRGPAELVTACTLLVVITIRIRHLATRHRTLTRTRATRADAERNV